MIINVGERIEVMKEIEGIEILNKTSRENKEFYLKKLNLLHDVILNLGYQPDSQFLGDLEFPEGKGGDDVKLLAGCIDTECSRLGWYCDYIAGCIIANLDRVSDTDLLKLYGFYNSHPKEDDYMSNILNKSECNNCNVKDVEETPKIIRTVLGGYTIIEE